MTDAWIHWMAIEDNENPVGREVQMGIGWACPVCGAVMAPWMPECPHCPRKVLGAANTQDPEKAKPTRKRRGRNETARR